MLGYRHAFHAGNHADVLKHVTLLACLRRMTAKNAALAYVDTHAGAGSYILDQGQAAQNAEWSDGWARLEGPASAPDTPPAVKDYVDTVLAFRGERGGLAYPGSPALAARALRPGDRLVLCELHPSDGVALADAFRSDRRARVHQTDGYAALKGFLPPRERRALIHMDPSYELAADYERALDALADALRRFATGVYLLWYPLLSRQEARDLPGRLTELAASAGRPCLDARLRIGAPSERGLYGSGMFVINPPWTLDSSLSAVLPFLAAALGDADSQWIMDKRELL
ncbi:MAG TPA: 23S rRNA (adenine(2030)-N(6))-methyltransferase RlmJ [Spirochaetales bacterium]|nr:23S rRNA (adenine(2030)-N(6))-methyltransferase RlmJ [Spirochaetales bacterium]